MNIPKLNSWMKCYQIKSNLYKGVMNHGIGMYIDLL